MRSATSPPSLRALLALFAVVLAALASSGAAADGRSAAGCGRTGYSYAGFASASRAHGIRAALTAVAEPSVAKGHVAAWVGVGGTGEGRGGTDAWLQVGVSAVAGLEQSALYTEVAGGGRAPRYTWLGDVKRGETHLVAVLEVAGRPDWWRVWVDGEARTAPIRIEGSSGRWQPIATAETWHGSGRVCNRFDFAFDRVEVAGSPGGSWRAFVGGERFEDPGYRLLTQSGSSFRATAV